MDDAINSFADVFVDNAIADRSYQFGGSEQIDITNVFASATGADPIVKTLESVSDTSILSASLNGNTLNLNSSAFNSGTVTVKIRATAPNNAYAIDEFQVYVYNASGSTIETFNDGSFTAPAYAWTTTNSGSGARNWTLQTTTPYEGTYCAGADALLKDSQWAAITATVNYTSPGSISFWKKTSSEENYDYLNFYLDGVKIGQWSGITAWSKSSFPVSTSGNHTIKFEYFKDAGAEAGTDQVWVDYIEFFTNPTPVVPPTPTLVSPSNGSSAANQTPTFSWNAVTGATSYNLLVDNNSDFSSPEISVAPTTNSYTVPTKALSAGTYYWKVKVTSASGSYSSVWTYTVTSGTVIPAVPANITTSIVSGNVYVNWDNSADATSYDVYSSSTPYGTFTLLTNVTASEYTYTPTATRMFFYIVAKNSTKESPRSISVTSAK